MYDVIIVGAGGFGREVYMWGKESFSNNRYRIKGFIDDNEKAIDGYNIEIGIVGNINDYVIEEQDRFLIAIGDVDVKERVVLTLRKRGAIFLNLIHPSAIVPNTATIGQGVIICPFVILSDNVHLSDFVMMHMYSSCGHDVKVGKYCIFSPYSIATGFSILADNVFLGTHATIIPGKKVGYRSKVSANSVVMRDVPPNRMVFGVPGRVI